MEFGNSTLFELRLQIMQFCEKKEEKIQNLKWSEPKYSSLIKESNKAEINKKNKP